MGNRLYGSEVQVRSLGDSNLGIVDIWMAFKSTRLDEITTGLGASGWRRGWGPESCGTPTTSEQEGKEKLAKALRSA